MVGPVLPVETYVQACRGQLRGGRGNRSCDDRFEWAPGPSCRPAPPATGPDSPWTPALARQLFEQTGWASILTLSDSRPYFQVWNCGMFVIGAQVCFLYGSAGLYKAQGGAWGNGTALHHVLNLQLSSPGPPCPTWRTAIRW